MQHNQPLIYAERWPHSYEMYLGFPNFLQDICEGIETEQFVICEFNTIGIHQPYLKWTTQGDRTALTICIWGALCTGTVHPNHTGTVHTLWACTVSGHRRSEAALRAATDLRRFSYWEGAKEKPSHTLTPSVNLYPIILKMLYLYNDHIQKISWTLNILKTQGSFKNYLPLVLVFLHILPSTGFAVTWPELTVTYFSF